MKKHNPKGLSAKISKEISAGFGLVETLLVILILGVASLGSYYVWHTHSAARHSSTPTQTAPPKINTTQPSTAGTPQSQQYLTIKEWGVKVPLTSANADAYYTAPQRSGGYDYYNLRVHSLDSENDCKNSDLSVGAVERMTMAQYKQAQQAEQPMDRPLPGVAIDNYYYFIQMAQYVCAQQSSNVDLLTNIRQAFSGATTTIVRD